ncbi:hypothetical protein CSB07_00590 [Candidatus Gracilibacteria bacterium]|nr:MAG: hypothetical protein CSB07_00590 [Candidatus Gracilibacteria bacterium]PIE85628.1 MAG: hypothetical protein CSA08_01060 [Candidatus Gracilibacteria bacterium]
MNKDKSLLILLLLFSVIIIIIGSIFYWSKYKQEQTKRNIIESDNLTTKTTKIKKDHKNKENISKDVLLNEFIDRVNELEKKSQEYGENNIITLNNGNLLTYIVYPKGNNTILNKSIKNWVDEKLNYYLEDSKNSSSELSIHSYSYIINDMYISVVLKGFYDNLSYAHPEDIIKTFTIDLKNNKIVSLDKILEKESIEIIKKRVVKEANLDTNFIDEGLLDNFIFTNDGLKIYLQRGMYTPMSDGSIIIELSKDFLKENNIIYFNSKNVKLKKEVINNSIVVNKKKIKKEIKNKKLIALTFDDGPGVHTNRLLNILKENNAKATFFVLGSQINKYTEGLINIYKNGHEIGNHTWSHKQLTKLSEEDIEDEIMTTRAKIFKTINVDSLAIRAPYGSVNENVKAVAKKLNMYFVHWSIDTLDWKTRNAESIYDAIIENASDGQIILCHDIHKQTVDAMDNVIKKLKSKGYEFVTTSELFKSKGINPKAGKIYYNARL